MGGASHPDPGGGQASKPLLLETQQELENPVGSAASRPSVPCPMIRSERRRPTYEGGDGKSTSVGTSLLENCASQLATENLGPGKHEQENRDEEDKDEENRSAFVSIASPSAPTGMLAHFRLIKGPAPVPQEDEYMVDDDEWCFDEEDDQWQFDQDAMIDESAALLNQRKEGILAHFEAEEKRASSGGARVQRCNNPRCKSCTLLKDAANTFRSPVTNREYTVQHLGEPMYCGTTNIIYLTSCAKCGLQYVGKTKLEARSRQNSNRHQGKKAAAQHGIAKISCPYLCAHFYGDGPCSEMNDDGEPKHLRMQPIERIAQDVNILERETYWIQELRTLYPYGLNHVLDMKGEQRRADAVSTEKMFNPIAHRCSEKRVRGARKTRTLQSASEIFEELKHSYESKRWQHRSRIKINATRKPILCQLEVLVQRDTYVKHDTNYRQFLMCLIDMFNTRLTVKETKQEKEKSELRHSVLFVNPAMEEVSLGSIVHSDEVLSKVPEEAKVKFPQFSWSYTRPIRNQIFNYAKTTKNITENEWTQLQSTPCDCAKYGSHCHPVIGHVFSGDLSIVKDPSLRKLLGKGPKYREPEPYDWDTARDTMVDALKAVIKKWQELELKKRKVAIPEYEWNTWLQKATELIEKKIAEKRRQCWPTYTSILNRAEVKKELRALHKRFVMCPIDKSENNVLFVCKRFYKLALTDEFKKANGAYEEVKDTEKHIVDDIVKELKDEFKITLPDDVRSLATSYWTGKMHKNPPKARFIAASNRCILKPLSSIITKCLKTCLAQHRTIGKLLRRNFGYNPMWVIDNSKGVLECIKQIKRGKNALNIGTYDFETLYTNIPHKEMKDKLEWVIREAFKAKEGFKFLTVSPLRKAATWAKKKSKMYSSIDQEGLIKMTKYLIGHSYVTVGSKVFKQVLGIPMGTDCAPFLANLFLYACEAQWLKAKYAQGDYRSISLFANTFRYIDDLITFNNNGELQKVFSEIYPKQLNLKKENKQDSWATFLDLRVQIREGQLQVSLYDKRDVFPFKVNSFPHLPANVSFRRTHDVIKSQLVRYARICDFKRDFFARATRLTDRLLSQGFSRRLLTSRVRSVFNVHKNTLNFRIDETRFRDNCFTSA
jgi:hypothetical protein